MKGKYRHKTSNLVERIKHIQFKRVASENNKYTTISLSMKHEASQLFLDVLMYDL